MKPQTSRKEVRQYKKIYIIQIIELGGLLSM